MDDRARLEHFMGIAHGVRRGRDGANGAAASPSAASALTPRSESQSLSRASSAAAPLPTASLGVQSQASVGSGIFSLLQWGSRDVSAAASTATGAKEAAPSIAGCVPSALILIRFRALRWLQAYVIRRHLRRECCFLTKLPALWQT